VAEGAEDDGKGEESTDGVSNAGNQADGRVESDFLTGSGNRDRFVENSRKTKQSPEIRRKRFFRLEHFRDDDSPGHSGLIYASSGRTGSPQRQPEDMDQEKEEGQNSLPPPVPPRLSTYQRIQRARSWFWSAWTDEAVLVYRRSAHGKDRARVLWVEFLLFVREILRDFYRVEGTARAASLAYTTLLSLIPLVVAFSTILRNYFSRLFPNLNDQIDAFVNLIIPYQSSQISMHLSKFVENAEAASTFGAIIFLVISFRLFMAVEGTINQIWRITTLRGYRQRIRAFTMLLFWGPLLIGLSFTTSASLQKNVYLGPVMSSDITVTIVTVFVLIIAFTMLFWLVPATRVQFTSAAFGAAITAVLFELVRWGFGVYAAYLFDGRLNVIYGTLGLMIIFLLALEMMWVVILLGVEISYVHQNLQGLLRASEQQLTENPAYDVYFAVRALVEIARRFELREPSPSSYRLAQEFGATDAQMLAVLKKLERAQLVKEIGGDWTGYLPGCDPDRITIDEVIREMEGGQRDIPEIERTDEVKQQIGRLFAHLQDCTKGSLEGMTIGRMVREVYGRGFPSRAGETGTTPAAG
jgi:membrane protein